MAHLAELKLSIHELCHALVQLGPEGGHDEAHALLILEYLHVLLLDHLHLIRTNQLILKQLSDSLVIQSLDIHKP